MTTQYEQRNRDLALVWRQLAACRHKGVHVYDDARGEMRFTSFAEHVDAAGHLAAILMEHGIGCGEKVLVCAETTPDFPTLWLALMRIGATPVPMPPSYALSGQYTYRERIRGILANFRFYCCHPADVEQLESIATELRASVRILSLPGLLQQAITAKAAPPIAALGEDAVAFVQFTSGSTKAPKGILVTYRNLFANVAALWLRMEIDPQCHRWVSWLPLYHDMGLVAGLLASFLTQTELILTSPQYFARRPLRFLALAEQYQANYCSMPNFAYEWILKRMQGKTEAPSLSSFIWMGVGAEPVSAHAMGAFEEVMRAYGLRGGVLSPCYGLAEATLGVSLSSPFDGYRLDVRDGEPRVTCGRALEGFEIKVSDGHIKIRGDSVASSALVDGREVRLLDAEGYYDTKDLGRLDAGELVVLGRADEMFVINGENCFPYDIESAARNVKGVIKRRVMCFQLPGTEHLAAQLVLLYETLPAEGVAPRIEADIRAAVLKYTGLNVDVVLGVPPRTIPVTPSGKLQRLRARQLFLEGYYQREANAVARPANVVNM
jgi:acyl-CoA synthetase (AMP-forming)/AMP-acid ligase II